MDYQKAAELQYGRLHTLEQSLKNATTRLNDLQQGGALLKEEVDAEDIAHIVAKWTGIPATRLLEGATVAVCNHGFLDKEGPFHSPQALLGKPLLHDTNRLGWQTWMRNAGLKHAGPAPGPTFQDFNRLRAAAANLKSSSGDPGLDAVLSEIELRVEVELAKAGQF